MDSNEPAEKTDAEKTESNNGSPRSFIVKLKTRSESSPNAAVKMIFDDGSNFHDTLSELEIALRTHDDSWVKEFVSDGNDGLSAIVSYLAFLQDHMSHKQSDSPSRPMVMTNGSLRHRRISRTLSRSMSIRPGEWEEPNDVMLCLQCLRNIMNRKYGLNYVLTHASAINCVAMCLNYKKTRTKTMVLEILAAICLLETGHQVTLKAFDHFKETCSEANRFHTLVHLFRNIEENEEFLVSCMQFINVLVHAHQDVNLRVFLQHEFAQRGLDEGFFTSLEQHPSKRLAAESQAYVDNWIDVSQLLQDSHKHTAITAITNPTTFLLSSRQMMVLAIIGANVVAIATFIILYSSLK